MRPGRIARWLPLLPHQHARRAAARAPEGALGAGPVESRALRAVRIPRRNLVRPTGHARRGWVPRAARVTTDVRAPTRIVPVLAASRIERALAAPRSAARRAVRAHPGARAPARALAAQDSSVPRARVQLAHLAPSGPIEPRVTIDEVVLTAPRAAPARALGARDSSVPRARVQLAHLAPSGPIEPRVTIDVPAPRAPLAVPGPVHLDPADPRRPTIAPLVALVLRDRARDARPELSGPNAVPHAARETIDVPAPTRTGLVLAAPKSAARRAVRAHPGARAPARALAARDSSVPRARLPRAHLAPSGPIEPRVTHVHERAPTVPPGAPGPVLLDPVEPERPTFAGPVGRRVRRGVGPVASSLR